MPPKAEGEGVEPPRPEGPPRFRDGLPRRGSPSSAKRSSAKRTRGGLWGNREVPQRLAIRSDPGRNRTRTSPGKSRELSIELRSQTWPAGIEPATPRVSGGRSTGAELRPQ